MSKLLKWVFARSSQGTVLSIYLLSDSSVEMYIAKHACQSGKSWSGSAARIKRDICVLDIGTFQCNVAQPKTSHMTPQVMYEPIAPTLRLFDLIPKLDHMTSG